MQKDRRLVRCLQDGTLIRGFFKDQRGRTYPLGRAKRLELGDGLIVPVDDVDEMEDLSSS